MITRLGRAIRIRLYREPAEDFRTRRCTLLPPAWACTRMRGHLGPCAAYRTGLRAWAARRLRER